jgi:formylmethanofuran dehydrogenase subunit C
VFERATRWRTAVDSQGGEVFINLVIGDPVRKAVKAKADDSNAAKVIVKGTLALSLQLNLLEKRFADFVKSLD